MTTFGWRASMDPWMGTIRKAGGGGGGSGGSDGSRQASLTDCRDHRRDRQRNPRRSSRLVVRVDEMREEILIRRVESVALGDQLSSQARLIVARIRLLFLALIHPIIHSLINHLPSAYLAS